MLHLTCAHGGKRRNLKGQTDSAKPAYHRHLLGGQQESYPHFAGKEISCFQTILWEGHRGAAKASLLLHTTLLNLKRTQGIQSNTLGFSKRTLPIPLKGSTSFSLAYTSSISYYHMHKWAATNCHRRFSCSRTSSDHKTEILPHTPYGMYSNKRSKFADFRKRVS